MLTVTNKAASLLKGAKTAEGAPQDAGIRLRLDSGFKDPGEVFVDIRLAISDGLSRVMKNSNKTDFAFLWKIGW